MSYTFDEHLSRLKDSLDRLYAMADEESMMSDSDESTISDYQSAMSEEGNTPAPVFGPQIARAELPPPLGKLLQLRIELEGARGLPQTDALSEGSDNRLSYSVEIAGNSSEEHFPSVISSKAQEGVKSLRGTVQWNEVLYTECFELSLIELRIHCSNDLASACKCVTAEQLLEKSECTCIDCIPVR
ncbi:hypothetical protein PENSPDRAFT_18620 [Peniophora sp. CONT]|nr:hypothetical protein PENSPDRAFT_18620 [Peniophora sp. CONT]